MEGGEDGEESSPQEEEEACFWHWIWVRPLGVLFFTAKCRENRGMAHSRMVFCKAPLDLTRKFSSPGLSGAINVFIVDMLKP